MYVPTELTIKHVNRLGETFLIAAHYVRLIPASQSMPSRVFFDAGDRNADDVGCREICEGTVFVMNSSGKTIDVLYPGRLMDGSDAYKMVADNEPKIAA